MDDGVYAGLLLVSSLSADPLEIRLSYTCVDSLFLEKSEWQVYFLLRIRDDTSLFSPILDIVP